MLVCTRPENEVGQGELTAGARAAMGAAGQKAEERSDMGLRGDGQALGREINSRDPSRRVEGEADKT